MRSMSVCKTAIYLLVLSAVAFAGCVEFSHFGQVSDRDSAWAVNNVKIEQQQSDGGWKQIGVTDGKGKFNIFKTQISGGGRIRLSKPGYQTVIMGEPDFLQQVNIVLVPSEGSGKQDFGNL
jgi:hypothetical protein